VGWGVGIMDEDACQFLVLKVNLKDVTDKGLLFLLDVFFAKAVDMQ